MKKHHLLCLGITSLLTMGQPVFAIDAASPKLEAQDHLKDSLNKAATATEAGKTSDGMKGPSVKVDDPKAMPQTMGNAEKTGKAGQVSGKADLVDKMGKAEPHTGKAVYADKLGKDGQAAGKADYADQVGKGSQLPGKPVYSDKLNQAGQLPGKAAYTGKLGQAGYGGKSGKTGPIPSKGSYSGK